jgi:hypothetical protein
MPLPEGGTNTRISQGRLLIMKAMPKAARPSAGGEAAKGDAGPLSVAARAEQSESHAAIQALHHLTQDTGVAGVTIWHHCDDEYDQHTFVVEAGVKRTSDQTLPYALMRAAGRMPTKFCTGCERERDISAFVKRSANASGIGAICDECNQRNVKLNTQKRNAHLLRAALGGTPPVTP